MIQYLKHNYHTHTSRCKHATGTDEEYVLEAILHGMTTLGFSDHIPVKSTDDIPWRMKYSEIEEYLSSVRSLKEKYKDEITILVGFESEFILEEEDFYRSLLEERIVDYLILGAHSYDYFTLDNYIGYQSNPKMIKKYTEHCLKQMESGLFKYLCHPDLYMKHYTYWDAHAIKAAHAICKRSKELNFPIEFNCEGVRQGIKAYGDTQRYMYPIREFWEIAAMYQCPVVIGVDAHKPSDLNSESIQIAFTWVKELGLQLIKDNYIEI